MLKLVILVMNREIKGIFKVPSGNYMPRGLNIWENLWWRFVPGEVIKVSWPTGNIVVNDEFLGFSADPNDYYRWELEKNVGRQGWDWNWGMVDNDVTDNKLTIKIRKKHARWISYFAMKWS